MRRPAVRGIGAEPFVFCRFTQLGFLRLLTNGDVIQEEVLTPAKAWETHRAVACGADAFMLLRATNSNGPTPARASTGERNDTIPVIIGMTAFGLAKHGVADHPCGSEGTGGQSSSTIS